jgi:hypothetical protein
MITQQQLKNFLHYNLITGAWVWVNPIRRGFQGKAAGFIDGNGYIHIGVSGKTYKAHRLAFLYVTGEMPKEVDHINRVRHDNRWCNLRPTSRGQNVSNSVMRSDNTSGYRGVHWCKRSKKWASQIGVNGKKKNLGYFDCKYHAFCEYVLASRKIFGEFSGV